MAGNTQQAKSSARERSVRGSQGKASWASSLVVAAAALVVGAGGGWLAHGASLGARGAGRPIVAAAADGAGACDAWASEVCKRTGDTSEGCAKAKDAASVLSGAACAAARVDVEETVRRLKAARASCDRLVEKLCGDLGDKSETCAMVREKVPGFPADRCQQMLDGYGDVIGELREMEEANVPISADLAQRQATGDTPGFGPKDAKLALVEYSDFQCPFCGRAAGVVAKLKEKYGQKVRFVFRQFPLSMHPDAGLAAEASLAAHAQGKFWAYHDLLFEHQRELTRASLEKYAQQAGLDMAKFRQALDQHTFAEAVKTDQKLGMEGKVSGTPSMFLGTERIANATDFDAIAQAIDAKLAVVN
jgi:protein-disulfide isomerase